MIVAEGTIYPTHLHMVFTYPDGHVMEFTLEGTDRVILEARARKIWLDENRTYIVRKLTGWLKQRMFVFDLAGYAPSQKRAAELAVLVGYFASSGHYLLCNRVASVRKDIEGLAPGERSAHYASYIRNIVPILDYCDAEKGAVAWAA